MARSLNIITDAWMNSPDLPEINENGVSNLFVGILPADSEEQIKQRHSILIREYDDDRVMVFGGGSVLKNAEYHVEFLAPSPRQLESLVNRAMTIVRATRRMAHYETIEAPEYYLDLKCYAKTLRLIMWR